MAPNCGFFIPPPQSPQYAEHAQRRRSVVGTKRAGSDGMRRRGRPRGVALWVFRYSEIVSPLMGNGEAKWQAQ